MGESGDEAKQSKAWEIPSPDHGCQNSDIDSSLQAVLEFAEEVLQI